MILIKKMRNRVLRKLHNFKRKIALALNPARELSCTKGTIYLYHGSLYEYEEQYKNPNFHGLALKRYSPRDLLITDDGKIPVPDESVDAFQSQDVFEHLEPTSVVKTLNDIHRVLKSGGFFRLSVPDYRSPLLLKRTIFNYKGEALGDAAVGACAFTPDFDSEIRIKHLAPEGDNHLWLPTYEKVKEYLELSKFAGCKIEFLHYIKKDGSFVTSEIPNMEIFNVQRVPPHDARAGGMPISIVVDLIKS